MFGAPEVNVDAEAEEPLATAPELNVILQFALPQPLVWMLLGYEIAIEVAVDVLLTATANVPHCSLPPQFAEGEPEKRFEAVAVGVLVAEPVEDPSVKVPKVRSCVPDTAQEAAGRVIVTEAVMSVCAWTDPIERKAKPMSRQAQRWSVWIDMVC